MMMVRAIRTSLLALQCKTDVLPRALSRAGKVSTGSADG